MIGLFELLIFLLVILFATLIVTQLIIPLIRGTRLFPMLLHKTKELSEELTDVQQEVSDSVLVERIKQARKNIRDLDKNN